MTTEAAPAADPREGSKIEQTINTYLEWDEVNHRWIIDPTTVSGEPLEAPHGVENDLSADYWTPEILADMEAAAAAPLPNGEELFLLLLEALPEGSRIKDAMAEVLEGAEKWADELRTYVAAANEAAGEHQTAANQLETADAIIQAVNLLNA